MPMFYSDQHLPHIANLHRQRSSVHEASKASLRPTYIGILDLPDLAATNERRDLVLLPALDGRRVASGEVQVIERETPYADPHGHARREVEYQG